MADQQTILITGANRGIGLELARQLKEAGHVVIGTARKPDEAHELKTVADRVERLDIMDARSVADLAEILERDGVALDVLVNNGALGPRSGTLEELDVETFREEMDIHVVGPLRVTQALLPALRRGTRKLVVSITSNLGSHADAEGSGGYHAYRCGKSALNMLNICMAEDLSGEGFTCLAVHPGWVRTRMGGENAPLSVQESVQGIAGVIESAKPDQSGSCINYKGETMKW